MAITVALINMKGGVGKSTLAVNIAWHFAAYTNWNKRVLVADLDPQFNASQYMLGTRQYENILKEKRPTMWNVFEQYAMTPTSSSKTLIPDEVTYQVIKYSNTNYIDIIPSQLELSYSVKSSRGPMHEYLSRLLKKLDNKYDLIVIDCAPTESILTTAAYTASDYILIPVKPEYLSTIGLPLLGQSLTIFAEQYNRQPLEVAGIVFNGTTNYSPEEITAKREVRKLAKERGWYVFKSEIPYSRSYPKGAREGEPIFRTSYARLEQASSFRNFANEFAERISL